jgi:hypothetical protein
MRIFGTQIFMLVMISPPDAGRPRQRRAGADGIFLLVSRFSLFLASRFFLFFTFRQLNIFFLFLAGYLI